VAYLTSTLIFRRIIRAEDLTPETVNRRINEMAIRPTLTTQFASMARLDWLRTSAYACGCTFDQQVNKSCGACDGTT